MTWSNIEYYINITKRKVMSILRSNILESLSSINLRTENAIGKEIRLKINKECDLNQQSLAGFLYVEEHLRFIIMFCFVILT